VMALPPKYSIEPMDLANMRQNGVRSLDVMCHGCRHEVVINVDQYPGDLLVREFGPRMVCTKCGMVGADARPSWKKRRSSDVAGINRAYLSALRGAAATDQSAAPRSRGMLLSKPGRSDAAAAKR
jgi:hypothetical protein